MRKLIVNLFKDVISILSGLQIAFPLFAFIYLLSWCLRLMKVPIYETIDQFIGFFPKIIDTLFYNTADLFGEDVPMGYVYASAICLVMTFLCTFCVNKIDKIIKKGDFLRKTKDIRDDIKEKKAIAEKRKRKINAISKFYGLIEFRLAKHDDFFEDVEEMKELKKQFSKMAAKKIKEKYPFLRLATDDKIFFICEDFSKFNVLINDVVKIFKLFSKLSREKDITTELIFSNYVGLEKSDNSTALDILTNINKLSFFNKIVVSGVVKEKYEYTSDIRFTFIPLGESKLVLKDYDLDVELYYLKNL